MSGEGASLGTTLPAVVFRRCKGQGAHETACKTHNPLEISRNNLCMLSWSPKMCLISKRLNPGNQGLWCDSHRPLGSMPSPGGHVPYPRPGIFAFVPLKTFK